MAKLVLIEGGKWVGVNNEGAVVFRVESLDDLKIAQLPEMRSKKEIKKQRQKPRWKDGSFSSSDMDSSKCTTTSPLIDFNEKLFYR